MPLWRKASSLLEFIGVTEKIQWKQAVLGTKGRMNPAFFKIWQYIKAIILSKIWMDRNQIAHQKPSLNLDNSKVKDMVVEACSLAKERKKLRSQALIVLKKLRKL